MHVVCVYLNFDMDEHGWAPAPGASPFPTPLIAAVFVAAHPYFLAISLSGNILRNKGPAWAAASNGRLCSKIFNIACKEDLGIRYLL